VLEDDDDARHPARLGDASVEIFCALGRHQGTFLLLREASQTLIYAHTLSLPHERKVCLRFNQAAALVIDKLRPDFADVAPGRFLARGGSTVGNEAELLLNVGLLILKLHDGGLTVRPELLHAESMG